MLWKNSRIVAFDTETTGLEPFGGDRVIEFGAVEFRLGPDGRVESREDHSWLINPERDIPRKVTDITGISAEDVADKPRFAEVAAKIRDLLADSVAVAHNFPFDLAFLTNEFDTLREETGNDEMRWPEPIAEIDTVDLSMRCFPDARSHRLSDLSERLRVDLERAHRATDDAAACGLCFVELARQHEVDDDLQTLLDWANAIGRPPEGGPIGSDGHGQVVFREGELEGQPVSEHPIHLAWMDKARVRRDGTWQWRYPEEVRSWVRRWLNVRGAGRAKINPKTFHSADWVLDPCIAMSRQTSPL